MDKQAVLAEEAADGPLTVEVAFSPQDPPSGDMRTTKADLARFQYSGGQLTFLDESLNVGDFAGCTTLRGFGELADKITRTPKTRLGVGRGPHWSAVRPS